MDGESIIISNRKTEHFDSFNGRLLPVVSTRLSWEKDLYSEETLDTAEKAVNLVGGYMYNLAKECSVCICQDVGGAPICVGIIGMGNTQTVAMTARDVIQMALLSGATCVTILHNHTSIRTDMKHAKPSKDDIYCTDIIQKACDLCQIVLLDSIVVGGTYQEGKRTPVYYSMREGKHSGIKVGPCDASEIRRRIDPFLFGEKINKTEEKLDWDNQQGKSDRYWKENVKKMPANPIYIAYSEDELNNMVHDMSERDFPEYDR